MSFDLLIRGGRIVTSQHEEAADIGISGGKIAAIGDLMNAEAEEVLDARGLTILPGVIDTQVHFREPGMEHKEDLESGTRAAVMGGVTTIFEMPNTSPATTTQEALEDKLRRAEGRAWCDYAFFAGASAENASDLGRLENLPGTPGIKIFMGSSTGSLLVPDDDTLRKVLLNGKKRCPVHAEDHQRLESRKGLLSTPPTPKDHPKVRDAECARLATERLIRLSEETGRPVHILHVSTLEELPMIAEAKRRGVQVTAEITPQHLYFAAPDCYEKLGTRAQMNPPVRSQEHRDALREAVRSGLFDIVGSDHAPHTLEEKAKPYPASPSGMPGVQTLLPVMLNFVSEGLMGLGDLVRLASENPAKLYNIKGKGRVEQGYDADLVLVDEERREAVDKSWLQSKCGWSPYEGEELTGWPIHVVLRGRIAVRDRSLQGEPAGKMVEFF
jgi:dihydroorotase